MRAVLMIAGLAAMAWGAVLATSLTLRDTWQGLAFFVGGPLLHDGLVAPVVGLIGWSIARHVAPRWRTPVLTGAVASGVLGVLAVPLLWRPFGVPTNPGLHDRDYWLGLGIALTVVWATVVITGLVRGRSRPG
ncbi:hypothetical protein [Actinokineospora sp. NBRC 105648]|uniref:hypothetical protein n=1 Tax=Actinokineospora sp. NBRC 105648 TaxID=3032206 RepID=UPI0024A1728B|nr:hypothetical protein [Actinokineospora sp. NBRC 105648]GLZ41787.1 hypothetical protein Acsp05_54110 [Actinokineospora sp. NBRC 105648]